MENRTDPENGEGIDEFILLHNDRDHELYFKKGRYICHEYKLFEWFTGVYQWLEGIEGAFVWG